MNRVLHPRFLVTIRAKWYHLARHGQRHTAAIKPLAAHLLFRGVYIRVAKHLRLDPSYVSRVARGKRRSEKIERALQAELARIEKLRPK